MICAIPGQVECAEAASAETLGSRSPRERAAPARARATSMPLSCEHGNTTCMFIQDESGTNIAVSFVLGPRCLRFARRCMMTARPRGAAPVGPSARAPRVCVSARRARGPAEPACVCRRGPHGGVPVAPPSPHSRPALRRRRLLAHRLLPVGVASGPPGTYIYRKAWAAPRRVAAQFGVHLWLCAAGPRTNTGGPPTLAIRSVLATTRVKIANFGSLVQTLW